jgi:hypothetical protein
MRDENRLRETTAPLRTGAEQPRTGAEQPRTGAEEPRTGAEQPWEPEDLAVAKGQDPTPENVERAREQLDRDGPEAIEKTVP